MGFFTDLFDGLIQQWAAEAAQQTPDQQAAMRKERAKNYSYIYQLGYPAFARYSLSDNTPIADTLMSANPIVERLMAVLGNRGYDNILSTSPQVQILNSSKASEHSAQGLYRYNRLTGQQRISVPPNPEENQLISTLLHEITHSLQDNPETKGLLEYHRSIQPPYQAPDPTVEYLDFAKRFPAIVQHAAKYMADPAEVQARGLSSAMLSDLLGVPASALEDKPHTMLLNHLLGRGYSPTPYNVANKPGMF